MTGLTITPPREPASPLDLERATALSDRLAPDYLEFYGLLPLGRQGERVRGPEHQLRATIRRAYGVEPVTAETLIAGLGPSRAEAAGDLELPLDDLVQLANEAPVVQLVNLLLLEALEARASDVHLEGYADELRVRYRVDGVLQDAPTPPEHLK